MSFFASLQQASFRGVPFGVLTDDSHFGRRYQLHQYPFRDTPWAQDLGKAARTFNLTGFLVEDSAVYGGGDVITQRNALRDAIESAGPGTLVHPTLGSLQVIGTVVCAERWDEGRYVELQFAFVEAGARQYPSTDPDTTAQVTGAVAAANLGALTDFSAVAVPQLTGGLGTIASAAATVSSWASQAVRLAGDATGLIRLASGLTGPYGRYFSGGLAGFQSLIPPTLYSAATTVADLAADAAQGRAILALAAGAETTIAQNLGLTGAEPSDLATAAQATTAALAGACANPTDQIRILGTLATYAAPVAPSIIAGAVGDLHRRAAVTALADASSLYQPSSYDDAAAVRATVTAALDAEIGVAGDQGNDGSFAALRALRAAVVQDLAARGAALAPTLIVTFPGAPTPALVLAQKLYRDATRADELIAEADPPNPLFMPSPFRALAA